MVFVYKYDVNNREREMDDGQTWQIGQVNVFLSAIPDLILQAGTTGRRICRIGVTVLLRFFKDGSKTFI